MLSGGSACYVEPRPRCTAWKPSRTPRQVVISFVRWIPPIVGTRAVTIIFTIMWWNYKIEVFTREERSTILKYMAESKYQYDTVVRLAFATGMRMGELFALRWEDVDDGVIHVRHSTDNVTHIDKDGNKKRYRELWETKSVNSVRDIPILNSTNEMLKQHRSQQRVFFIAHGYGTPEYVFTTKTGEVISHSNFRRSYQRMLARAGVPYRKFHAVRHTFATEAIRSGVDVKDLQLLMGHSDISTTYIYVQSDNESRKNAIEKIGAIM